VLTVQSVAGGFNADASRANPFTVSAHAVNADPLASIIDDTNPGGTVSWVDFYSSNILAADSAAHTVVDGFGTYTFDVSAVVNSWITGTNTIMHWRLRERTTIPDRIFCMASAIIPSCLVPLFLL
jgi:hypothetical protein